MHLCGFLKRLGLTLFAVAAMGTLSLGQDSTAPTRPSQAECSEAATYGRALPEGCSSADASGTRQGQDAAPNRMPELTAPRETPEWGTIPPLNPSQRKKVDLILRPHTEFEQIVADTTGRALPIFGQSLFLQPPSTFAPTDHVQVPADYVVGPGDELQIRIWGQINADLRVVVDRSGQIYIPRVGPIQVAGVHYSNLDQKLQSEILKLFKNFNLTVNIGRIRSIQIFVVGQAHYPGTYTISSLSTLVNAIFASGGPTAEGSLRDVQVQRDGKTISHLDFYDLLVKGDKSKDVRLQSGDVLYYPAVGPLVAIAGSVNAPAIYELKSGTPLEELIETAGGLSTVADSSKITVERIGEHHERSVLEFPLDAEARALRLNDGDIVRVLSIVPRFGNSVTLRGNVVNPGRYPWKRGMKVRDLIPDAQTLLTRPYWMNRAGMVDGRSTEYPIGTRRSSGGTKPNGANADSAGPRTPGSDDASNGAESRISSEPGRGSVSSETLTGDLHRTSPEINWSYAIIQRVNPVDLSTSLVPFDLGKAVLNGDPANNLELEPDDSITIFSQSDVAVPQGLRPRYIRVEGEVVRAGVYKVEEGELLRDALKRAGGVTPDAYIYGTQLTRESARIEQQQSIDELARTLETESREAAVSAAARGAAGDDAQSLAARQTAQQALIAQLKNTKASGRVVLTLPPTANSIDAYPPILLEDNDRVVVPHLPSTVSVVGMVYNTGSFVFSPRRKVGDYLKLAGKGKPNADMHHAFVLHADGTVTASTAVNSMFTGDKFASLRIHPGDQIVVPNKIQTGNFIRGLRDWTQISSQLALTGAALAVIR